MCQRHRHVHKKIQAVFGLSADMCVCACATEKAKRKSVAGLCSGMKCKTRGLGNEGVFLTLSSGFSLRLDARMLLTSTSIRVYYYKNIQTLQNQSSVADKESKTILKVGRKLRLCVCKGLLLHLTIQGSSSVSAVSPSECLVHTHTYRVTEGERKKFNLPFVAHTPVSKHSDRGGRVHVSQGFVKIQVFEHIAEQLPPTAFGPTQTWIIMSHWRAFLKQTKGHFLSIPIHPISLLNKCDFVLWLRAVSQN